MPGVVFPDEGVGDIILSVVDPARVAGMLWRVIFFVNDYTPSRATVLADLVEASWNGYTFYTIVPANWQTPSPVTGGVMALYGTAPLTWTVLGALGQTNYGWAIIDPGPGVVRLAQRFEDDDIVPLTDGSPVQLQPQFGFLTP